MHAQEFDAELAALDDFEISEEHLLLDEHHTEIPQRLQPFSS